jgi:uncharacterized protein YggL (DUF469 family)
MRTLELTDEQKKTLKLFSYYCGSYGAKTATLTVYLNEGGTIDWIDSYWYSETNTIIETYDKINELIDYILRETELLNYYDYDGSGTLEFEIDIEERKMSIEGWHREHSTRDSIMEWSDGNDDFGDLKEDFDRFFEQMDGENGRIEFNGSGDDGYLEADIELSNGQSMDIPSFIQEFCYDMLRSNYGGWEINEGSQGSFKINPSNKLIELYFEENIEEEDSDGTVGYVEF